MNARRDHFSPLSFERMLRLGLAFANLGTWAYVAGLPVVVA